MRISDWSSDVCSSDLASGAAVPGSRKGVGHRGLALGDEGLQRLVDAGIDGRRLVVLQRLLPRAVGALVGVAAAFRLPLLEGVVVGGAGAPEGGLEVGAGVGAAEEVAAGDALAQRGPRLAVFAECRKSGE